MTRWVFVMGSVLALVGAGACLDFGAAYDDCVARGDCRDGAGVPDGGGVDDGGVDAGADAGGEPDAGVGDAGCQQAYCFLGKDTFPGAIFSMWTVSPAEVWASGDHLGRYQWNGTQWLATEEREALTSLFSIWAPQSDRVWTGGQGGTLFERQSDGLWVDHRLDAGATNVELRGVSGTGDGTVWLVGGKDTLLQHDSTGWSNLRGEQETWNWNGIWVDPSGDTGWIVGSGGRLLRLSNGQWVEDALPDSDTSDLWAVWGTGADDVWLIGVNGGVYRYVPGRQEFESTGDLGTGLRTLYFRDPSDVFVGGTNGFLRRFDGTAWEIVPLTELTEKMTVLSITQPEPRTLFISGYDVGTEDGFVLRYELGE